MADPSSSAVEESSLAEGLSADQTTLTVAETSGLSATVLADLRAAFDMFDRDGSGFIDSSELRTCMKLLGYEASEKIIENMVAFADQNDDGQVSFDEWIQLILAQRSVAQSQQVFESDEIRHAFDFFDKGSKGYINTDDIHDVLTSLGEDATVTRAEDLKAMIDALDTRGTGVVTFDEFAKIFRD